MMPTKFQNRCLSACDRMLDALKLGTNNKFELVEGREENYYVKKFTVASRSVAIYVYANNAGYMLEGNQWIICEEQDYDSMEEQLHDFLYLLELRMLQVSDITIKIIPQVIGPALKPVLERNNKILSIQCASGDSEEHAIPFDHLAGFLNGNPSYSYLGDTSLHIKVNPEKKTTCGFKIKFGIYGFFEIHFGHGIILLGLKDIEHLPTMICEAIIAGKVHEVVWSIGGCVLKALGDIDLSDGKRLHGRRISPLGFLHGFREDISYDPYEIA